MVILQGLQENDILKQLNDKVSEVQQKGTTSTFDNALQFIGLVLLLIVIIVAAYYTSRFAGAIKLGQLKDSNFKVIDTYRISPNKALQIVQVGNKYIVIAISKDTVSFITELEEQEIKFPVDKTESINFKQILDRVRNK